MHLQESIEYQWETTNYTQTLLLNPVSYHQCCKRRETFMFSAILFLFQETCEYLTSIIQGNSLCNVTSLWSSQSQNVYSLINNWFESKAFIWRRKMRKTCDLPSWVVAAILFSNSASSASVKHVFLSFLNKCSQYSVINIT